MILLQTGAANGCAADSLGVQLGANIAANEVDTLDEHEIASILGQVELGRSCYEQPAGLRGPNPQQQQHEAQVGHQGQQQGQVVCRICLKRPHKEFWDLFGSGGEVLQRKLMTVAAVQIQRDDGLSTLICSDCKQLAEISYNFKCQVEQADQEIRQTLLLKQNNAEWMLEKTNQERNNALGSLLSCLTNNKTIDNTEIVIDILPNDENNDSSFIFNVADACNLVDNLNSSHKNETSQLDVGLTDAESNALISDLNSTGLIDEELRETINSLQHYSARYDIENDIVACGDSPSENQQNCVNQKFSNGTVPVRKACGKSTELLILRSPNNYKCDDCDQTFSEFSSLEKHTILAHNRKIYFFCFLCDEQFKVLSDVTFHVNERHGIILDEGSIIRKCKQIGDVTEDFEKLLKFHCKHCGKKFLNEKCFQQHLDSCVKKKDDIIKLELDIKDNQTLELSDQSKLINNNEIIDKDEKNSENNSSFSGDPRGKSDEEDNHLVEAKCCDTCGKKFATQRNLRRHLMTHAGLRYICQICTKQFSRLDKLREHEQCKHQENASNQSDDDSDSQNDSPKRKKVKNVKPFECTFCKKSFVQRQSLINHLDRHAKSQNREKRYLCEVCSKCFAQSGSLVAHMRTHTGVKPYVCEICSRAFTKSTYLQLHLRTHSGEKPYICQYCNQAFARANTLARHVTMHTGEAKYQCQVCFKSFRRLTSLNEHSYTHTGQRPYACKLCSKRYNNAGSLYAHSKKCKDPDGGSDKSDDSLNALLISSKKSKNSEKVDDVETLYEQIPISQLIVSDVECAKPPENEMHEFNIGDLTFIP